MRPIKFRIWDGQEMIYPSELHNEKYVLQLNCSYAGKFNGEKYDHIDPVLMQFTGLTDCKNKDLYVGDVVHILNRTNEFGNKFSCKIEVEGCDFVLIYAHNNTKWARLSRIKELSWDLEKIGNLYENPELI